MTIRLRCAECKRKLKVPDEALGKKVQCPACGARFIGYIESNPSPSVPDTPPKTTPSAPLEASAPTAPLPESFLVDSIFAEMTVPLADETAAPPALEGEDTPKEAHPAESEPWETDVLDEESAFEPVDADVVDLGFEENEEAMEVVEEADAEDEVPSEFVEEADAEDDIPARRSKPQKEKKSRKGLLLILVAVLCALLLGLGGAYFVYQYING